MPHTGCDGHFLQPRARAVSGPSPPSPHLPSHAPRGVHLLPHHPRPIHRSLDDYDLEKQLYRGKASLLYSATCRHSGQRVVLKLYRKHKLSELNWYQVPGPVAGRRLPPTPLLMRENTCCDTARIRYIRSWTAPRRIIDEPLRQLWARSVAWSTKRHRSMGTACNVQVAREIQIHSTLHHDHIIALYGAFEDSKHVYLVQEFAVGATLRALHGTGKP